MIQTKRCEKNPLLSPHEVKPSHPDYRVDGVFNAGICRFGNETLMLCRIAESIPSQNADEVIIPAAIDDDGQSRLSSVTIVKSQNPDWSFDDARKITSKTANGSMRIERLTSLSHMRLARAKDGVHFKLDDHPVVPLLPRTEGWGAEDPRITQIGDTYYINYTSVTKSGPATSLISTKDFVRFERHGVIFAPENKDVTIFPEKIGGMYYAFNRPSSTDFGSRDMWLAESPDLIHWGNQQHFYAGESLWENGRVGGGAPPIKTEKGWLVIYHAADKSNRYCLGAMLIDLENPMKMIARSKEAILTPDAIYEQEGFFGNVVFTCGCLLEGEHIIIYYGASDDKMCRADISLKDMYKAMGC